MVKKRIVLMLAGLALGLGMGLYLGWIVWPVEYYDTDLGSLRPNHKLDVAAMTGAAYELDGDWERALARLNALGEEELGDWLRDATHNAIAEGQDPTVIEHLISLAEPLGVKTDIMEAFMEREWP